jgi:hypothetical protein
MAGNLQENFQNQEFPSLKQKVQGFIESLGNIECSEGSYNDEEYGLNGYYYYCESQSKWFTLIINDSGVYIRTPFHFSKSEQVISKLSKVFNINLNKLRFSQLGFFRLFKLEPLPDEIINLNLTTDDDEIDLSTTTNNRILIDVMDKISLLYDKGTKKFIILSIKNWETYEKIRDFIDHDVREILDKLLSSKPEFIVRTAYGEELGLEGKRKEITLKLLSKLMPIVNKINKIEIRINENENEVILNDIVLGLKDENWGDIPIDVIEKLLTLKNTAVIELHKDFWFIKVHYNHLLEVANILGIDPMQTIHDINPRKESLLVYEPRDYYIFSDGCGGDYYHIVPSKNLQKYLQLLGVNITQTRADGFEINDDYKYVIIQGQSDEIHVGVYKENKLLTSLKTYLWYFGVKDFSELKNLNKEKVIDIINRQINERYFYPMPFDQVKQYVEKFLDTTIKVIDETIGYVRDKVLDFTSPIKDIAEINCIFDKDCEVALELDEQDRLSSYYSLISTNEGHMPVPIFLEYAGLCGRYSDDEDDISMVKNMLYFIRGYDKVISEYERDYSSIGDDVRGAVSELFQKAVVLYNKLLQNKNNLPHPEDDEDYEEYECPQHTLPDGMGYCRKFDYEPLMKKSEEELANEIIQSLTEIRDKMTRIREKLLKSDSVPVIET